MPRAHPVQLPRLLSLLPKNGVGARVYESRWEGKKLPTPSAATPADGACYWDVTKTRITVDSEGKAHGRAWGVLTWKGKRVTPADKDHEPIRGGLKHLWRAEAAPSLLLSTCRPAAPSPAADDA
ncbi:hypothetical protein JCM8097_000972 [Rhodosporidiobolus ruineniae]